jgi:hypothetical protein
MIRRRTKTRPEKRPDANVRVAPAGRGLLSN